MTFRKIVLPAVLFSLALSVPAFAGKKKDKGGDKDKAAAEEPAPAADGKKRDPKGQKGISPFWESIKKGDDSLAAKDIDGAKASYQEAIRSEPQNPMGHYRMGEAELTKGNLKEAEASWQTALRFSGENPALRAKVLFVLADVKERQRMLDEATSGWTAYADNAEKNPKVKTYPETPPERKKRITDWKQMETDYAAVKERIKARLEEAEKKAAESAQSPQNR
ncbi:MAG TPA: tetratricopeptide repeat protein [Polyangiaceae bacterium]|nr:tetratricopeptide repeat protein [Polyangiaceae bacterium]